jgi:sugar lactone lactonase YvrE
VSRPSTPALALLLAIACGCSAGLSAAARVRPTVRLIGKPPPLVAGQPWTAVVVARGGTPRLQAVMGATTLRFGTSPAGGGRYRARVLLPKPGRWTLTAILAGKRFALARLLVSPASYPLALPAQLLVQEDGSVLLAERLGRDRVLRIDPASGRFTVFATGIPEPFGLARAADGGVLASSDAGIYRVPAGGGAARRVHDVAAGPIVVAPNGDILFGHATALGRIDASSGRRTTYPVDVSVPHGLALAPDGSLIVSDTGHQRVLRVDLDTGHVIVLAANLRAPVGLALDRSGRILVLESDAGTLAAVEPGGGRTTIASGLVKPYALAVSGDGAIYVDESGDLGRATGRLARIGTDGAVTRIRLAPG